MELQQAIQDRGAGAINMQDLVPSRCGLAAQLSRCKATSNTLLAKLSWARDGKKCVRCEIPLSLNKCHTDHIISGKNATNELNNLRTLCRRCHALRVDKRPMGVIAKALKDGIIPHWSGHGMAREGIITLSRNASFVGHSVRHSYQKLSEMLLNIQLVALILNAPKGCFYYRKPGHFYGHQVFKK